MYTVNTSPKKSIGAPGGRLVRGFKIQMIVMGKVSTTLYHSSDMNVQRRVKNGRECIRTVRENLVEEPYSFKLVTSIPGR